MRQTSTWGQTVRFRAHRPGNETEWFTMGSEPLEVSQCMSSPQVGNVMPAYVAKGTVAQGVALPITIWGKNPRVYARGKVDGTTVELKNVVASDKQIQGEILYSDWQGRPLVARQLEVNLALEGPGMRAAEVYDLDFVE